MIVYGKQIVLYLLRNHPKKIEEIFLAKDIEPKLFHQITRLGVKITRIDSKRAQAMARGGNHQGMFAQIAALETISPTQVLAFSHLVVLCGVSDVGNIGSLMRTAYALGVEALIVEGSFSLKAQETMMRSSSGAMLDLPICFCSSLLDFIHHLKQKDFECYGASMHGECFSTFSAAKKWALFLGSEGDGLRNKIIQKMDKIISIEMQNNFDSLNVGVAGGILMYGLVKNGRES